MGQYYTLITIDLKRESIHNYTPTSGNKLMEFAYYHDYMANLFCSKLYYNPQRVIVLGDYAEQEDFKAPILQGLFDLEKLATTEEEQPLADPFDYNEEYVINHTTNQYIKLEAPKNSSDFKPFEPLLLCALGNGKGGGDYFGVNEKLVGSWAGCVIEVVDKPSSLEGLEELKVSFDEV